MSHEQRKSIRSKNTSRKRATNEPVNARTASMQTRNRRDFLKWTWAHVDTTKMWRDYHRSWEPPPWSAGCKSFIHWITSVCGFWCECTETIFAPRRSPTAPLTTRSDKRSPKLAEGRAWIQDPDPEELLASNLALSAPDAYKSKVCKHDPHYASSNACWIVQSESVGAEKSHWAFHRVIASESVDSKLSSAIGCKSAAINARDKLADAGMPTVPKQPGFWHQHLPSEP